MSDIDRARQVFDEAVKVPAAEREEFVRARCGDDVALAQEVLGLVKEFVEAPTITDDRLSTLSPERIPERVGRYRILYKIGEGGMGVVYAAELDKPRLTVALKLIRTGFPTQSLLKRFEAEAEILARLQHPGIAQIYDAGTMPVEGGDGLRPYFAMELVRGKPLTEFAAEHNLGVSQRLELLIKICQAVQHAHGRGVIHRDLKPANILVDETGQPKILDFGVARATDADIQVTTSESDLGQLIGTLAYMSPEQARGDPKEVDARSDVYAIGVIAFELLSGRMPYDLAGRMVLEAVRVIVEEDPTKLSTLDRTLRGDLEVIVGAALEKDKERRYETAAELATELQRYLNNEPIVRHPPSVWYQTVKFARRNKAFVGGVAAVFVVLVLGLAGTSYGLKQAIEARKSEGEQKEIAQSNEQHAREQRDAAIEAQKSEMKERRKSESINQFMQSVLQSSDPNQGGKQDMLVTDAMTKALKELDDGAFKEQPEIDAGLRLTIAEILNGNGHSTTALPLAVQALDIFRHLHPGDHADVATGLNNVAMSLQSLGRSEEALPEFQAALEMRQRLSKGDNPDVALALNNVAFCLRTLNRPAEALPKHEAALEMYQRLFIDDHPEVVRSLINVAGCLGSLARSEEALPKLEAALEMNKRMFKGDHPSVANGLSNVAFCLQSLGRSTEALSKYEAALEMQMRLFKGDNPDVALGLSAVALCLNSMDRSEEALAKFEVALEMYQRLYKGDHQLVARGFNNVGGCLKSLNRCAEAVPNYQAALEMYQRQFKGDYASTANSLKNLAICLSKLERLPEALEKAQQAADMAARVWPEGHPARKKCEEALAEIKQKIADTKQPAQSSS